MKPSALLRKAELVTFLPERCRQRTSAREASYRLMLWKRQAASKLYRLDEPVWRVDSCRY